MAESHQKHLKEFSVSLGRGGDKENTFGGFYSRVRTIRDAKGGKFKHTDDAIGPGQNWIGEDTRRALFGLWSKKEEYTWSGRTDKDGAALFRRTKLIQNNSFAATTTEFYENGTVKEKTRKYITGDYHTKQYDADGDLLSETNGDILGYRKRGKSEDRRTCYSEEKVGPFRHRKEGLLLPDGTSVGWRTVRRNIGPYKMSIDVGRDGKTETRSWSLGKLISRSSEYNFETGMKTISYKFPFRKRDNKERPITAREVQKHEDRMQQREIAQQQWVDAGVYSSHLLPGHGENKQGFQRALASREPSGGFDVGAWLENVSTPSSVERRQQPLTNKHAATWHDRDQSSIVPDDSITVLNAATQELTEGDEPTPSEVNAKLKEALQRARRGQKSARIAASHANSSLAVTKIGATEKAAKGEKWRTGDAAATAPPSKPAANIKPGGKEGSPENQKAPIQRTTRFSSSSVAGGYVAPEHSRAPAKEPGRAQSFASPTIVEMTVPPPALRTQAKAAPPPPISNSSVASSKYEARDRRRDARSL